MKHPKQKKKEMCSVVGQFCEARHEPAKLVCRRCRQPCCAHCSLLLENVVVCHTCIAAVDGHDKRVQDHLRMLSVVLPRRADEEWNLDRK